MEVDKKTAAAITDEIEAAAKAIFAKHGLMQGKVSTKYGMGYELKITADLATLDESGINLSSREAQDYKTLHKLYDLPEGLLGKKFSVNGKEYIFAGLATKRSKYPIYVKNVNTGAMSFFQSGVKRYLVSA
jgi:hypothetical protein